MKTTDRLDTIVKVFREIQRTKCKIKYHEKPVFWMNTAHSELNLKWNDIKPFVMKVRIKNTEGIRSERWYDLTKDQTIRFEEGSDDPIWWRIRWSDLKKDQMIQFEEGSDDPICSEIRRSDV